MSTSFIDADLEEHSFLSSEDTNIEVLSDTQTNLHSQVPYGRKRSCWKKNPASVNGSACKNVGEAGVITCGICGVQRYYKFIKQTKKYGLHSCEPCRKFITAMIQNVNNKQHVLLSCSRKGPHNCLISEGIHKKNGSVNSKRDSAANGRCKACWLTLCLEKYEMPIGLRNNLAQFLAEDDRPAFNTTDTDISVSETEITSSSRKKTSNSSEEKSCLKVLCQNYLQNSGLRSNSKDSNHIMILRIKR